MILLHQKMDKSFLVLCFLLLADSGFVFGYDKKQNVGVFELKKGDISLKVSNWGASIISLVLPDKNGKLGDVVLGYDSIKDYFNDSTYFGATVGRVANRIGGAQFTLNGLHYKLVANEGNNTLHGGSRGFSDVAWKVRSYQKEGHHPHIVFTYRSSNGEQGFPGDLVATVGYHLVGKNELAIIMKAKALNKPTPVNLANHAYWNLGGHNSGNILSEVVQIFGSKITPVNSQLIPTGKFQSVRGTPYDFLKPRTVGSRIKQLPKTKGYDMNYVLDGEYGKKLKLAAIVQDHESGRVMELSTNAPGLQFYTGNYVKDVKGKGGYVYEPHAALCLETQAFPDSVNHPNFPSTIVTPQKPYRHYMLFRFSTKPPYGSRG
ncbi:aldose 1-epimerase-like [Neltuma alba]|uniref:aldose 1-epimerase-like n=1 Tax=Neltuma alba TaxID=207710 RepID=UPI0010A513A4|nr:aldose 1-epimerase-like [Prosopis alba]